MEEIKINEFWPWLVKHLFLWEFLKPPFLYFKFQIPHSLNVLSWAWPSQIKSFLHFLSKVLVTFYVCVKLYAFKMFSNNFWPSHSMWDAKTASLPPISHVRKWCSGFERCAWGCTIINKDKARARTQASCLRPVSFLLEYITNQDAFSQPCGTEDWVWWLN